MTISLVLFSARHCLFPARFRLAYYRALLLSPRLPSVFRSPAPPLSLFSLPPGSPNHRREFLPARFLAALSASSSFRVCLRRASVRRPTACPSVHGYRFQSSSRRFAGFFVHDNCSESGFLFSLLRSSNSDCFAEPAQLSANHHRSSSPTARKPILLFLSSLSLSHFPFTSFYLVPEENGDLEDAIHVYLLFREKKKKRKIIEKGREKGTRERKS